MHDPDSPKDQQSSLPANSREEKVHRQRGELSQWIRAHTAETGAIYAALAVVISVLSLMLQGVTVFGVGMNEATSEGTGTSGGYPSLTVIGKVKQSGAQIWSDDAETAAGARIVYGLRIENSGPEAVDNVVVRVALSKYVEVVPGSCRYGFDQVAVAPCPGVQVTEGAQFPQLESGEWLHLVVSAEVSADAPGGRYLAMLAVSSDQTDEIRHRVEVRIPASAAEKAVRDLYQATEEDANGFWDGVPAMALRSKRFLIDRWADLGLERSHGFDQLPEGPLVSLSRLYYDHRLEGRVVELNASIVAPPGEFSLGPELVKQKVEIGVVGETARAWCYAVRPAERLLRFGDDLEIKGIPIAWGIVDNAGKAEKTTAAVCPAIHRVAR